MNKKDVIICRCEDVTLEELHNLMKEGYTSFEEIKRILRVGMGSCQGNTCGQLIQRELANFTNTPINKVVTHKVRPLFAGVKLKSIVKALDDES